MSLHSGNYDGAEHNPKLLPCSHTICIECLTRIVATFARDSQFRSVHFTLEAFLLSRSFLENCNLILH